MGIVLYDLAGADPDLRFSPHCWRTRMALAHKGLDVETVPWRFTETEAIADSGQGKVPVIVDQGRWIHDSWEIALHLERTYPDRPALFTGSTGVGEVQFVRAWTDTVLHPSLVPFIILDIFHGLAEVDQAYFRQSRQARFGRSLEEVAAGREERLPAFRASLAPLRSLLGMQPFVAGDRPMMADYLVFGAFQWARTSSPFELLAEDDAVHAWRARMLALFGGLAGSAACCTARPLDRPV